MNAARNYLQLHLLVALCLLVIGIFQLRAQRCKHFSFGHCPRPQVVARLSLNCLASAPLYLSQSYLFLAAFIILNPLHAKPSYSRLSIALPFHPLILNSCSSLGSVCGSGTSSFHSIDGSSGVLRHVIVSHRFDYTLRGGPDENCTFCAGSHDELLVRGDSDLSKKKNKIGGVRSDSMAANSNLCD